jgi:hypothetical protein
MSAEGASIPYSCVGHGDALPAATRADATRLLVPGRELALSGMIVPEPGYPALMATAKQRQAARANVKKAQAGAKKKQTLKKLPKQTRTALGKEAAAVRRGDEPTRKELEAQARKLDIRGRSKMGKAELKRAVARAR